jgi:tetratricopeptide (TPR) repeat protein
MWNQPARASARIESWLAGPPSPDPTGAASAWSFLAQDRARTGRWDAAGEAYARATELAPNPRTFVEWGMAEAMRGDHARAAELYARAAALDSNLTNAWLGLAASASWLDRAEDVGRAAREIQRLAPGHPRLADIDAYLARAVPANRSENPPVALAHVARPARRHAAVAAATRDSLSDGDFEFGPALAAPGHGGSTPGEGANPNPR